MASCDGPDAMREFLLRELDRAGFGHNTVTPAAIYLVVRSADGRFVFLCPFCREMLAYGNPKNNLAHCFACHVNFNTIDLLRACGHDFLAAVALLERWLEQYQARRPHNRTAS